MTTHPHTIPTRSPRRPQAPRRWSWFAPPMRSTTTSIPTTMPLEEALEELTLLTDAGLETELVFHDGRDLPAFASFPLLDSEEGRARLATYYRAFIDTAVEQGMGFVAETPTWRANPDWAASLGYDAADLDRANRKAVAFCRSMLDGAGCAAGFVSGNIGPRGDGYEPGTQMRADEAAAYHSTQIRSFAAAGADLVSAFTLSYVEEAVGVATAAARAGLPSVVSFTVETDGRLPSGESLADAIRRTDEATGTSPLYYMVNCAHPTHFSEVIDGDDWSLRIRAVRANASRMSHAELDAAEELDDGDPAELAAEYRALRARLPRLAVIGGCCGTDHRHVAAIAEAFAQAD